MIDSLELPGIPPLPKKRGRPATGKAKTAAQRKADSRKNARRAVTWSSCDEFHAWLEAASARKLLEAYPELMLSHPRRAVDVAQRLLDIARQAAV